MNVSPRTVLTGLRRKLSVVRAGWARLETRDVWLTDPAGHKPGAFDCPCGPFVSTDVDAGVRVVRHIPLG